MPLVVPFQAVGLGKRHPDRAIPTYATAGSAGLDLRAAIPEALDIAPGGRERLPTGVALELPTGYEGQVRPRSGLAWKHGLTVLNSPGTVDSDYRGELMVVLINHGSERVTIEPWTRIAQLVIAPAPQATLERVEALNATARGSGGYGSTGTS